MKQEVDRCSYSWSKFLFLIPINTSLVLHQIPFESFRFAGMEQGSFHQLPAEVVLEISKQLPDLRSVYAFAQSCSRVYRLFLDSRRVAEVFNAITLDVGKVTPQTCDVIWTVVLLRRSTCSPWPVSYFWDKFMEANIRDRPPQEQFIPPRPGSVPLGILATASRVQDWVQVCLWDLLVDFRQIVPQLDRLIAAKFSKEPGPGPFAHRKRTDPENLARLRIALGPASWVEEQVVTRAFWRYQMLLELKEAAIRWGPPTTSLDESVIQELITMPVADLVSLHIPSGLLQGQEFLTISDYIKSRRRNSTVDSLFGVNVQPSSVHVPEPMPSTAYDLRWKNEPAGKGYVPTTMCRRGSLFWEPAMLVTSRDVYPFHETIPVGIFRQHGLALWDNNRMLAIGLASKMHNPTIMYPFPLNFDRWQSGWRSLVSDEEYSDFINGGRQANIEQR